MTTSVHFQMLASLEPFLDHTTTIQSADSVFSSTAIVTVEVGEEKESHIFSVHEDFLCYYSPYFRALFEGSFQEAQTKKSVLREHSPDVFEHFLNWMYTQRLEVLGEELPDPDFLIRLWVLADMLLIPDLQNIAIKGIEKQSSMSNSVCSNMYQYVYENTVLDSPLRKLMVFQVAWQLDPECVIEDKDFFMELPADMARDLVFELMKRTDLNKYNVPVMNIEDFYVNNNNVGE